MGLRYPRVSGPRMRTILLLCLPVAALVAFVAIVFVLDLPDLATQRCCFAAGGFLGSLGAGGVLAGHARGTPKMRRHPQPLVAYRSLADLYVSLHFFVFSLVGRGAAGDPRPQPSIPGVAGVAKLKHTLLVAWAKRKV